MKLTTTSHRPRNRRETTPTETPNADDNRSLHPLWKTSLCSYFRKHAPCSHGETCRYAHSEEELRPRPDSTRDPTSERGKKALRSVTSEKVAVKDGVMMTELVDDVDGDGGDDGFASNQAFSKYLAHLPKKRKQQNLRLLRLKKNLKQKLLYQVELTSQFQNMMLF